MINGSLSPSNDFVAKISAQLMDFFVVGEIGWGNYKEYCFFA